MERFHGSFEYSLDPKSRIILPARLRTGFEAKKAYLSCYVDRCLAVWAPDVFNHYLERAEAMEAMEARARPVPDPQRFLWRSGDRCTMAPYDPGQLAGLRRPRAGEARHGGRCPQPHRAMADRSSGWSGPRRP